MPYRQPEKPLLDPGWDDDADVVLGLLAHEILTTGAVPLHPDDNRITHYDPVPLVSSDDHERAERRKKDRDLQRRLERRRYALQQQQQPPPPPPPLVKRLPPSFTWLIKKGALPGEAWMTQGEVEAFWQARRDRTVKANLWQGWPR